MSEKLTDTSIMPFGKHKGKRLIDVPAQYLYWLHTECQRNRYSNDLHDYIEDNMDAILQEMKK